MPPPSKGAVCTAVAVRPPVLVRRGQEHGHVDLHLHGRGLLDGLDEGAAHRHPPERLDPVEQRRVASHLDALGVEQPQRHRHAGRHRVRVRVLDDGAEAAQLRAGSIGSGNSEKPWCTTTSG
jgi:hypothetical protein